MAEVKIAAASGGGSISIKGPASSGSDVDLVDTSGNLNLADGKKLNVGDGDDLEISHTSNLSTIKNTHASGLAIRSDIVMLQNDAGDHDYLTTANETGVSLYYDNTKIFETHANGFYVKGPEGGDASVYLYADEGDDDADKWRIVSTTGGELHFENKASGSWEDNIKLMGNGGVNLYHDNSIKFQTYSGGLWCYGDFLPAENSKDVGSSSSKWDDIHATNGTIQTSDRNEKTAIVETDLGLSFVNKLKPVSYKFNTGTRTHYGLIAQDIETTLSDISKPTSGFAGFIKDKDKEDKDIYGLRYSEFIAPLIKSIQELSAEVETLKTKVAALEAS